MRKPKASIDGFTSNERFSRRVQCGVKIFEHDIVTRVRTSDEQVLARSAPRLIVTDAINAARDFVSKSRSEFRELDDFLKSLAHT